MRLIPSSSAVVVIFHLFLSTLDLIASISISFRVAIFGVDTCSTAVSMLEMLLASLLLVSFIIYIWLAITDNFSVQYIANHSNTELPVFYKISSIWSAHEGSMFLWIIFIGL